MYMYVTATSMLLVRDKTYPKILILGILNLF